MEAPPAKPSALKRVCRKALFVVAALITLIALFIAEEDWRGSHEWQNYKRAMEAKGEHFDAARLIPPKVPDDQNFAMTPYFAPLFYLPPEILRQPIKIVTNMVNGAPVEAISGLVKRGTNLGVYFPLDNSPRLPVRGTWACALAADLIGFAKAIPNTNSSGNSVAIADPVQAASIVLDHLKPCEPTLAELHGASSRHYSQFNIPWEEWDNPQVSLAVTEHLGIIKGLYQILSLHAESEMVLGRANQALDDINVLYRVDDALKDEPAIISQLIRLACTTIMLQSVGEGLAEHRWSEAQLQVLQEQLHKTDLIASVVHAWYGERDICSNPNFDRGYMPRAWNRLEQLNMNRGFDQFVFPRIDLTGRVISPSVNHSLDLLFQQSYEGKVLSVVFHHKIMASMMLPALFRVAQKAALAQSDVDMAMLACALERYHLAHNQYPDELNAMVPGFVAVLPHDIINGQPLKYHRTNDGRFIIYSVGWNEKDDGGVVATAKGSTPRQDPTQGDWVWQYPPEPRKMTKG